MQHHFLQDSNPIGTIETYIGQWVMAKHPPCVAAYRCEFLPIPHGEASNIVYQSRKFQVETKLKVGSKRQSPESTANNIL
jgi:hypothetical protein